MTRAEDFARLTRTERLRLLRFVTSFAWSDLAVTVGERAYVQRLVSRLNLAPEEVLEVRRWMESPPLEDAVDPTDIPRQHRQLFLDTVREMVAADGDVSPEEKESLALLEQLTR
jgi:uncharacterized tellurite resistance protein B-like protein